MGQTMGTHVPKVPSQTSKTHTPPHPSLAWGSKLLCKMVVRKLVRMKYFHGHFLNSVIVSGAHLSIKSLY